MAVEPRSWAVPVVPLKGANYPTWKVQVKMSLIKDALWDIVSGSEVAPSSDDEEASRKFAVRRDRALAVIVLSVDPGLLYLLGDPQDPKEVWNVLENQFQKKSWANKLHLRKRLYSCRLKEGGKLQEHLKTMTELFHELAIVASPLEEEDRVICLLASLPQSYEILVTALEAHSEVPSWEMVTERLLSDERKKCESNPIRVESETGLVSSIRKGPIECFRCGKAGHVKRNCRVKMGKSGQFSGKPNQSRTKDVDETVGLTAHTILNTTIDDNQAWIVDSGATCHMGKDAKMFSNLETMDRPLRITLGDGRCVSSCQRGKVPITMRVNGRNIDCTLHDVLLVPELSFNLFSISKSSERGASVKFEGEKCLIFGPKKNQVAVAKRKEGLYHLDFVLKPPCVLISKKEESDLSFQIWHRRLGHLGASGLEELSRGGLVTGMDMKNSNSKEVCEPCIQGKIHRSSFPKQAKPRANGKLGLVHSDVCGKIGEPSLSGGEYFLTFIDDHTHFVWVYVIKKKSDVFKVFLEWKR